MPIERCMSIKKMAFIVLLFINGCSIKSSHVYPIDTTSNRKLSETQIPTSINLEKPTEEINTKPEETLINAIKLKESRTVTPDKFLQAYGWTISSKLGEYDATLPTSFVHEPGVFPRTLYWAFNNELSKAIGLDFTSYLGETVLVTVYSLEENLPTFLFPYTEGRAVILRKENVIVGAWVDVGMYLDASSTLDRRSFREIIDPRYSGKFSPQFHRLTDYWGEWLIDENVVLFDNELEQKLASFTPEQLIQNFFSAINEQNYVEAYAHITRDELSYSLFVNILSSGEDGKIYHDGYMEAMEHGYNNFVENIAVVEIIEIKQINAPTPEIEYTVTFNVEYKEEDVFYSNGNGRRFFVLREEIEGLGYRIDGIGTGP